MTSRKGAPERERRGKPPTINDVARLAQVSKKTVSRVINESALVRDATRQKVQAIIEALGFVPDPQAQGLAFRRSFLIGMIYDDPAPHYVMNLQRGILDAIEGTRFSLVVRICNRRDPHDLSEMRSFVARQKLSGVVLPPPVSEDERLIEVLREIDCPYVRIAPIPLDEPDRMVVTHDHAGGLAAARHLTRLGHARIAHISGPSQLRSVQERRRGFVQGLAEAGLKLAKEYDCEAAGTFETGAGAAAALLAQRQRPTAIFCGNDEMAAGVCKAARDAGLAIPEDISVIGYDDSPWASRLHPTLTSVAVPVREAGRMAASKLIAQTRERRAHGGETADVVPQLVVRESAAKA